MISIYQVLVRKKNVCKFGPFIFQPSKLNWESYYSVKILIKADAYIYQRVIVPKKFQLKPRVLSECDFR